MNLELLNNTELTETIAKINQLKNLGFDVSPLLAELEEKYGMKQAQPELTKEEHEIQERLTQYEHTTKEEFLEMYRVYALTPKKRGKGKKKKKKAMKEESVNQYIRHIREFFDWYAENGSNPSILAITEEEAENYIQYLRQAKSCKGRKMENSTVNSKHSSVSAFYSYLNEELKILNPHIEEMEDRNYFKLIEQIPEDELNIHHDVLNTAEMNELLDTIKRTTSRRTPYIIARNHLLFRLAFLTGLRSSEVTKLTFDQIDEVQGVLNVLGKGDKKRFTLFTKPLAEEFNEFLKLRSQIDTDLPYVFVTEPKMKQGKMTKANKLSGDDVNESLEKYLGYSKIELNDRNITMHSLRHSFATMMIREMGYTAEEVKEYCGHSSLDFTLKHYCNFLKTERDDERFEKLGV